MRVTLHLHVRALWLEGRIHFTTVIDLAILPQAKRTRGSAHPHHAPLSPDVPDEAQVEFLERHFGPAVTQNFHLEGGFEASPIRFQPHDETSQIPRKGERPREPLSQPVHFLDTLPPQAGW